MRVSKSFVDLLFILLCSTIVLLSESIHLGSMDMQPVRLGGGGVSPLRADEVHVVVVGPAGLRFDGEPADGAEQVARRVRPGHSVILTVQEANVSHHRVMEVWSALTQRDVPVKLGVEPRERPAPRQHVEGGADVP